MKYPAYPQYKDSGVAWLGEVPVDWEVKKARYLASMKGGSTPLTTENQFWDDGNIPWVSPKDMKIGRITDTQDHLTSEGASQCASGILAPGHVLIVVRSGILRHSLPVAINDVPVTLNQDIRAFKLGARLDAEYLRWFIEGNQKLLLEQWCKSGTTVESIEMSYLADGLIPVPPRTEQTTIADFLDRETGRIDTLVAKKRKLVELLKEKRSALISRTVTRGLPADAAREFGIESHTSFKQSGVEWLGEIPKTWEVMPIKHFCDVRDGTHDTPEYVQPDENTFPLVTSKDLVTGKVTLNDAKHISKANFDLISKRSNVSRGDILMPMIGTVGGAVIVDIENKISIKNVALFKTSGQFAARWLLYVLNSELSTIQFDLAKSGGVQGFVALGTLRNLIFAFPSYFEQTAIATYLDRETAKIDRLVAKVETAIARLQEYRSALITAAVTGKIDVRAYSAKQETA